MTSQTRGVSWREGRRLAGAARRRQARRNQGAVVLLLGISILLWVSAQFAIEKVATVLPPVFRVLNASLTGLPIRLGEVLACGCWTGPRGQAEKKMKFSVFNDSNVPIRLDGTEESSVRLLVAYKDATYTPVQSVPSASAGSPSIAVENPKDLAVKVASEWTDVHPSEIRGAQTLFGVPDGFRVWALAPNPNLVVENNGAGNMSTFSTVLDKTTLLPGESMQTKQIGHGTWVFYVPGPPDMPFFEGGLEVPLPKAYTSKHLIILGIAIFDSGSESPQIIGFAPAPPESAYLSPRYI